MFILVSMQNFLNLNKWWYEAVGLEYNRDWDLIPGTLILDEIKEAMYGERGCAIGQNKPCLVG